MEVLQQKFSAEDIGLLILKELQLMRREVVGVMLRVETKLTMLDDFSSGKQNNASDDVPSGEQNNSFNDVYSGKQDNACEDVVPKSEKENELMFNDFVAKIGSTEVTEADRSLLDDQDDPPSISDVCSDAGRYSDDIADPFNATISEEVEIDAQAPGSLKISCDNDPDKVFRGTFLRTGFTGEDDLEKSDKKDSLCPNSSSFVLLPEIDSSSPVHSTEVDGKTSKGPSRLRESSFQCKEQFCNICGEKFLSKKSLVRHYRSEHTINEHRVFCQFCLKPFFRQEHLLSHIDLHHKGAASKDQAQKFAAQRKVFTCEKCSKQYSCRGTLNRHLRSHAGFKNFECHFCHRKFLRNEYLNNHLKSGYCLSKISSQSSSKGD